MKKLTKKDIKKLFDDIKQIDENGNEFWSARALQVSLGYKTWENFSNTIERAKQSVIASNLNVDINVLFRDVTKRYKRANRFGEYDAKKEDIELARYGAYLIAMNGDSDKAEIAAAQSYFAIQTYRQEKMAEMSEEQKRIYIREQVTDGNKKLMDVAKESGVYRYGTFNDAGYLGLYGIRQKDIISKKQLGDDKLLDRAGSTELAANLFRITQTQDKLKEQLQEGEKIGDSAAINIHNMVGGKVRQTIKDIGGVLPENLPPEKETIKELKKRIKNTSKGILKPSSLNIDSE